LNVNQAPRRRDTTQVRYGGVDFEGLTIGRPSLSRHHPRKRMIQYAAAYRIYRIVTEYWMPAFAGMTTV
jgi:hypothetical protein